MDRPADTQMVVPVCCSIVLHPSTSKFAAFRIRGMEGRKAVEQQAQRVSRREMKRERERERESALMDA